MGSSLISIDDLSLFDTRIWVEYVPTTGKKGGVRWHWDRVPAWKQSLLNHLYDKRNTELQQGLPAKVGTIEFPEAIRRLDNKGVALGNDGMMMVSEKGEYFEIFDEYIPPSIKKRQKEEREEGEEEEWNKEPIQYVKRILLIEVDKSWTQKRYYETIKDKDRRQEYTTSWGGADWNTPDQWDRELHDPHKAEIERRKSSRKEFKDGKKCLEDKENEKRRREWEAVHHSNHPPKQTLNPKDGSQSAPKPSNGQGGGNGKQPKPQNGQGGGNGKHDSIGETPTEAKERFEIETRIRDLNGKLISIRRNMAATQERINKLDNDLKKTADKTERDSLEAQIQLNTRMKAAQGNQIAGFEEMLRYQQQALKEHNAKVAKRLEEEKAKRDAGK